MNAWIKLTIGCVLMGVGFVFATEATSDFRESFAKGCEDCDDEKEEFSLDEDIKSFVDVRATENEVHE